MSTIELHVDSVRVLMEAAKDSLFLSFIAAFEISPRLRLNGQRNLRSSKVSFCEI